MEWKPLQPAVQVHGGNGFVEHVVGDAGEHAARKTLKPSSFHRYDRFRREVLIASTMSHEQLCPIIDSYLPDTPSAESMPYFVMPWYDGGTLHSRIHEGAYLGNLTHAAAILLPIVEACLYLHSKGVYHRDIKPKNILLTDSGAPVLADFGLCYAVDDARLTATQEMAGSQLYMAPEYATGRVSGSDHSFGDVFSLGKTLWSMLAGREPPPGPVLPYAATNLIAEFGDQCRDAQSLAQALTRFEPTARLTLPDFVESLRTLLSADSTSGESPKDRVRDTVRSLDELVETDISYNERLRSEAEVGDRFALAQSALSAVEVALRADDDIQTLLDRYKRIRGDDKATKSDFEFRIGSPNLENNMQPGEHLELAPQLGFADLPKSVALVMNLSPTGHLVERIPMVLAVWSLAVSTESPYVEARLYVYSRSNSRRFPCEAGGPGISFRKRVDNLALRDQLVKSVPRQITQFLNHIKHVSEKYFRSSAV